MIPVKELIYGLDQKLNSLATQDHQDLGVANKILALRGAQIRLINKKMNPTTTPPIGMDGSRKRYQDLQILIEDPEKHPLTPSLADSNIKSYKALLSSLTPKYMYMMGGYLLASKGPCKDRVIGLGSDAVTHSDVGVLLNNSNYKPSFEYQETFYSLSNDDIVVYTDGTFEPSVLYIRYLRYPAAIDIEGYFDQDDNPSTNVDCELADYLKDELLELAVIELGFATENKPAVEGAIGKLQLSE